MTADQLNLFRRGRGRAQDPRRALGRFVARAKRHGWTVARLAAWFDLSERQLYRYLSGASRVHPQVVRVLERVKSISRTRIRLRAV